MENKHTDGTWVLNIVKDGGDWDYQIRTEELSGRIGKHIATTNKYLEGKGEANAKHIVKCVNMHDELVRLLRATSEYLDSGDYPENETQFKLFNDIEQALKSAGEI